MDWVTSPGATIQSLLEMWKLDYHDEKRPMNICIVAGLNNVIKGDSNDDIIAHIKHFYAEVVEESRLFHPCSP